MFYQLLLQAPAPPTGGNTLYTIIFWGGIFAVLYFFMIRPQGQARRKEEEFKNNLKKGKKVVTIGGIHGTIVELHDKTVELLVAPKVFITVQREAISAAYTEALNSPATDAQATDKKAQPSTEAAAVQPDSQK